MVRSIFESLLATVGRFSFRLRLCLETTRETYIGEALLTYRSWKTGRSRISGGRSSSGEDRVVHGHDPTEFAFLVARDSLQACKANFSSWTARMSIIE